MGVFQNRVRFQILSALEAITRKSFQKMDQIDSHFANEILVWILRERYEKREFWIKRLIKYLILRLKLDPNILIEIANEQKQHKLEEKKMCEKRKKWMKNI